MDPRPHIFDLDPTQLTELLATWGMPSFRATQILEWVYRKKIADPAAMSNLSKLDRQMLAERLRFTTARVVEHQSATDGVEKLLMDWSPSPSGSAAPGRGWRACEPGEGIADQDDAPNSQLKVIQESPHPSPLPKGEGVSLPQTGNKAAQTECVMIPSPPRKTACISSQIGCPVGCRFCASGLGGLDGNLTTGQIVEQVWQLSTLPGVERITHVVFMGMGEPLANFDSVVRAVRTLNADWGLGISARRITISTVGVPAPIRRLAELELPVTLALSLHAPNDELRRQLIPWAQYVTIEQLIEACSYYFDRTGREITLEYILLRDVNDRPEHARELSIVARRLRANVNLIRYNEVKGLPYGRPATDDVLAFQNILKKAAINTHIRASRGRDIAAACGQLRHEKAAS